MDLAYSIPSPSIAAQPVVVEIGGAVQRPLTLDLAALREFACASIEPFDLVCFSTGRYIRPMGSYRGVQLRALLDAAGVRRPDNTDFKRTVFLAHAHDGYAVTFSWHELFNTPIGAQVIIAYECADRELGIEDGLPVLVSGADTVHAPRHMKRLVRVDAHVLGTSHR
ncbi:molybdopterin-dependent oxidoreductase [Caballeronia novacaledonica]|jgi:DMSO/TMAO reductase YedYZ molybdopterin-dependent catalytic subunit|uniref:Molybdopterin-dependent oxidoreductase n=1 Tax=Caballeronia novacaledonica TaxID=1544861 RepID=A0AA37I729_9BURK|nr:molybdopterin-dependent oxidoreductase [Caballeronia novacaledonica]GJH24332.1 molybdopterin-dependent oxidoreductase [Caballeronia novacaledonica]